MFFRKEEQKHRDDNRAEKELLLNESVVELNTSYTPAQFENSLGKLQCVTVKAPRQIIDQGHRQSRVWGAGGREPEPLERDPHREEEGVRRIQDAVDEDRGPVLRPPGPRGGQAQARGSAHRGPAPGAGEWLYALKYFRKANNILDILIIPQLFCYFLCTVNPNLTF